MSARGTLRLLGERVLRAEGPGGMAVFVVPKRGIAERLALLAVDYGSNDLTLPGTAGPRRTPAGIAHFLEHTLFETDRGNASDLFSARGAYSNAFTDNTSTAYVVSAPDRWTENLDLLLDFTLHPPFPPQKVEKERGIILQELAMYRDSASSRLTEMLQGALYRRHPVRIDIGGTPTSVRAIRRRHLLACHAAYYVPSNLCLVVVGDVSLRRVLAIARKHVPSRRRRRPPHLLPREPDAVRRRRVEARLDITRPRLLMGFKDAEPPADGRAALARRIQVSLCLGQLFDRSAPLYQSLYADGLIDEDFGAAYGADRGFAYAALGGQTRDPIRLHRRVLEGLAKARREGFPEADLDRAKRKSLGSWIRLFDNPHALAPALASAHFQGLPLEDFPDLLKACPAVEVAAVLDNLLTEARHALAIAWPKRR